MTLFSFGDLPIRQKLIVIMMVITGAALILSAVGIMGSDSLLFRGYLQRDIAGLASIIGENSTAALSFDDPKTANETLAALRARTHLIDACIYRPNGTILARYSRPGAQSPCPAPQPSETIQFTNSNVISSHPIVLKGQQIGTLVIDYDLGEMAERRTLYGGTVLGVLLTSSLIAFLLSSRLRDTIATPILELARATSSVSKSRDYSIRAQRLSRDELGSLVDAFNEMLAGIQYRDSEVRTARDSLETTLASIGDAVISTDIRGRIAFANRVALGLLRRPEQDLTGKPLDQVFTIVNEFTRSPVESPVAQVLRDGHHVAIPNNTILITADNAGIPLEGSGAPLHREGGPMQGAVLVFRDVSARRKADETSRLLASIVESSADAIIASDLAGTITSWNAGAEHIFGYSSSEIVGQPLEMIAAPGREYEIRSILQRIAAGERIENFETLRSTKSGEILHVALTVSPIYDALGRVVGASKIARDITGRVLAAQHLAALNADLQRINENLARSNEDLERFAFVASHDLQEPLRMITIYSQLLVKLYPTGADEKAATFISNIVGGTQRMRELLADLLAYTEVGAEMEQVAEPVDLNMVLKQVLDNLKLTIANSGAIVTQDPLPVLKLYGSHLIPLFQNLIENAIKYRGVEPPRIHVSVARRGEYMELSITDNGIGIEPQYHDKIFVAFKRLHGKSIPGTGIGLAICQRVVERYGGRIWVESEPGRGSSFKFTLPARAEQKDAQTASTETFSDDLLVKRAASVANGELNEPKS